MKRKLLKTIAVMGVIPVIAFANPFGEPMFGKEPRCDQGMPHHPPGHWDEIWGTFAAVFAWY